MAMTQADVDTARRAIYVAKQTACEAWYTAVVNGDKPGRQTAKQTLSDLQDREDALANVESVIKQIANLP